MDGDAHKSHFLVITFMPLKHLAILGTGYQPQAKQLPQ
jgi:hypothetical protein